MELQTEPTDSYTDSRHHSKALILKQIDKSPGIRYRELLRLTGLTNGGLEYHLILEHDLCTFGEIVEHIKKAPSTSSWHLKRLSDGGIISITYGQEYQLYSIVNNNLVKAVLYKYEESFRDKITNGYYEAFGEL